MQDALYNATGRLRENLFSGTLNSAGVRNTLALPDSSPYGRMRDSAPLGIHTSPLVGVNHTFGRHATLTQSMDHLGLSQTLDRLPSPTRAWASQANLPSIYFSLSLFLVPNIIYM